MENNNSYAKQFRQALNERLVKFNKDFNNDSDEDFISQLLKELNSPDEFEERIKLRLLLEAILDGRKTPNEYFVKAFYKALENFSRRITPVSSDTVCADNE